MKFLRVALGQRQFVHEIEVEGVYPVPEVGTADLVVVETLGRNGVCRGNAQYSACWAHAIPPEMSFLAPEQCREVFVIPFFTIVHICVNAKFQAGLYGPERLKSVISDFHYYI